LISSGRFACAVSGIRTTGKPRCSDLGQMQRIMPNSLPVTAQGVESDGLEVEPQQRSNWNRGNDQQTAFLCRGSDQARPDRLPARLRVAGGLRQDNVEITLTIHLNQPSVKQTHPSQSNRSVQHYFSRNGPESGIAGAVPPPIAAHLVAPRIRNCARLKRLR
jgi:hypothetical protein